MQDLAGRVVVVTGGNGGIGLGMAEGCAKAGADVAIWGRNEAKLAVASEQLSAHGTRVEALVCDVSDEVAVDAAFATTLERLGKVDTMMANAGRPDVGKVMWDYTLEEWREVMATNLDGVFLTFRVAIRHMIERGEGGALVAVSSTSAVHGAPFTTAYGTAKTGLLGMTRALAVAVARYGIRVNALLPGWTATEMMENAKQNEKFVHNTTSRTPVRRWADPAEFNAVGAYLADPALTFHTGDAMVVDGAYTIF
jgi:NAD(P)-dependent dehydrogenase (short-subunit alcohol dehydrogenase family)